MKKLYLLLLLLASCKHDKVVKVSFYYWKTVYKNQPVQNNYLKHFNVKKLYVRLTDIDRNEEGIPVAISAIKFQDALPKTVEIVPVIFIVNDVLKTIDTIGLKSLASHILSFVDLQVVNAGKKQYQEIQIDCDWTASTRNNYFFLLDQISKATERKHVSLSATLRLHQLKNQRSSGVPPVKRVMLMCYNMGNLRLYGTQNSILDIGELKKYSGHNLSDYPLPVDLGFPLFSWAVVFRNKQYIGISKKMNFAFLNNKNQFKFIGGNLYLAATDLPDYGLQIGDEIRWESTTGSNLNQAAAYLSPLIKTDTVTLIYFHLDENLANTYPYVALEKNAYLLR